MERGGVKEIRDKKTRKILQGILLGVWVQVPLDKGFVVFPSNAVFFAKFSSWEESVTYPGTDGTFRDIEITSNGFNSQPILFFQAISLLTQGVAVLYSPIRKYVNLQKRIGESLMELLKYDENECIVINTITNG